MSTQSVVINGAHPAWNAPSGSPSQPKLVVRNSLTDTKEIFVPAEGNIVRMYVCGPTVYSVSHMGHARTFLCFDILRRILEKYFRFNVLFQMNITDIDDKIILAARKNELVEQYKASNPSYEEVRRLLDNLIQIENAKFTSKRSHMMGSKPEESSREFAEFETQIKQIDLKIEQLGNITAHLCEGGLSDIESLVNIGRDLLANHLDSEKGHLVEDKAIFEGHARYYESEFLEDCRALNIREPDVLTRVTEYVDEIVAFIKKIEINGYAYESNGSVYFDTQKFKGTVNHDYPKLVPHAGSGATDAEIAEGEGALSGAFVDSKKHRNDFALWKKSKSGEPRWDSPWGLGRPGWHIECSVMATAIHGRTLDIHGGGVDLKFPHHDNEIAQTEAHFDIQQWTNYFLHAGHLHIKGLKMAKSLKNFITIRQALSKFTAKQIRIMFLLQQWDKPVNFSDQTLSEAKDKENRINSFFARVAAVKRNFPIHSSVQKWDDLDANFADSIVATQERVHAALCDNFDTPTVMEALEGCISSTNQYLIEQQLPKYPILLRASDLVKDILSIFGVVDDSSTGLSSSNGEDPREAVVNQFILMRDRVRELASASKDSALLELSDKLRDEVFVNLGIKVVDGSKKAESWSFANPEDLRRELEQRADEKRDKEVSKIENKITLLQKDISRYEKFADATKSERDILFPTYTQFDEEGLPVGEEISASKRKNLKKDLEKFRKEKYDFEAKGGVGFLNGLNSELSTLRAKIRLLTGI